MTITLDIYDAASFVLAKEFAKVIHAKVIDVHLGAIGTPRVASDIFADSYRKMQAAIRSIPDPGDRRFFKFSVGEEFKRLRKERGTLPTTRAHVAAVEAYRNSLPKAA